MPCNLSVEVKFILTAVQQSNHSVHHMHATLLTDIHTAIYKDRQTVKQAGRQAGTDGQTDRCTDRQTESDRQAG